MLKKRMHNSISHALLYGCYVDDIFTIAGPDHFATILRGFASVYSQLYVCFE